MIKMVPIGGDNREEHGFALLNTTIAAHLFTAGPRPDAAPTLSLAGRLEYGLLTVGSIPDDGLRALWNAGLAKLSAALFTASFTPDKVFLATHLTKRCRWFNETGAGGCPLCEGECPHVDLRLMPVAGLMASCATCPPDRAVVVGPLYTPSFGRLETRTDAIAAEPITDCNGIARMAPFTDYSPLPRGQVRAAPLRRPAPRGVTHAPPGGLLSTRCSSRPAVPASAKAKPPLTTLFVPWRTTAAATCSTSSSRHSNCSLRRMSKRSTDFFGRRRVTL
jgi:hypothetical protein